LSGAPRSSGNALIVSTDVVEIATEKARLYVSNVC
jgi:hypothetical protein